MRARDIGAAAPGEISDIGALINCKNPRRTTLRRGFLCAGMRRDPPAPRGDEPSVRLGFAEGLDPLQSGQDHPRPVKAEIG
jgi:hypothetical protein